MADEDKPRREISVEELTEFLASQSRTPEHQRQGGHVADEGIAHLIAWLLDKWGNDRPCPYCANTLWNIGEKFIGLPVFGEPGSVPALQIVCDQCGHIVLVSAQSVDLLPPSASEIRLDEG